MWSDEVPTCPINGDDCNRQCAWYLEDTVDYRHGEDMTKYRRCAVIALVDALESTASAIQHVL